MNNDLYLPSGELQGDTSDPPDRGCTTGLLSGEHGVDLSCDATQSLGGISGSTGSDARTATHFQGELQSTSDGNMPGDQFNGSMGGLNLGQET